MLQYMNDVLGIRSVLIALCNEYGVVLAARRQKHVSPIRTSFEIYKSQSILLNINLLIGLVVICVFKGRNTSISHDDK